ncbi:histidine--tRNA ligase family protein, partial [Anaerosalibacter bizertensis]|nr:histidine--tRNA ligase family protein [Anaerosalibacter bizertensis]
EKFGFLPIDTPVIEKSEILLAKGGGETEKQIYRFKKGSNDMSLRFDLTVPLARYVAQYFPDLNFPFKRYHIGKVYRGERNQRGRFKEFYQCDIDIVGNGKLGIINDAEIPSVIYSTFKGLGFENFTIKINNRKILNGFFNYLGIEDRVGTLRSIDKIDKIGINGVKKELDKIGLSIEAVEKIIRFMNIEGTNEEILHNLEDMNIDNEEFQ